MRVLSAVVAPEDAGRQIKYFVRGTLGVSHRQFNALKIREGLLVNGALVHANYLLRSGDRIEVRLDEDAIGTASADDKPVVIVYEDEDYYVIDKPAPLACQKSDRRPEAALENRLAHHFGPDFVFRPVNRLDKGTSGLMAAAKNAHAYQLLQKELHTEAFIREYLAVVEGEMPAPEGVIDRPIAKIDAASVRRVVDWARGKPAVTHYRVERAANGRSLLRLRLETGRTHQIRVHLSDAGCPVCGDFLYGEELPELPRRFALHAAYLAFVHPLTGARVECMSPLPEALARLLEPDDPDKE